MIDSNDALSILGRAIAGTPIPGSELLFDGTRFVWGGRSGSVFSTSDDFVGGNTTSGTIGELGWKIGSTAGTPAVTEELADADSIGVISIATGGTSGNDASLHLGTGTPVYLYESLIGTSKTVDVIWKLRLPSTFSNADFRFGIADSGAAAAPGGGLYLEKLAADTNWFAVGKFIGETRVDTGIAAASSAAICARLRIVSDATAANARAYAWAASSIAGLASATRISFDDYFKVYVSPALPFAGVVTQTGAARSIKVDLANIVVTMTR